jgi:aspartate/methionine/tyrosine aminotransferase
MSISNFAAMVNHPICDYMQRFPIHKANNKK